MLILINFILYCIVVGLPTGDEHSTLGPITPGTRDGVPGMNMIVTFNKEKCSFPDMHPNKL